jgi:serine/threonine-protein phosphatase 4 regulatory subunit 1
MFGGEGREAGAGGEEDFIFNEYAIDDTLDALTRVERYHTSDFALQRLVLIRDLGDTAREAGVAQTMSRLLPLLPNFVADTEPSVRLVFVEQLFHVATFLIEKGGEPGYTELTNTFLPFAFELVVDKNVEVGNAATQSVIKLASLVKKEHVEAQLLNVVTTLAHDERAEDYRVVAAQLCNDLAELFGKSLCESAVISEVATLSEDMSFSVRRAVAANLGKIMATVGPEVALDRVFPIFHTLCKDEIWGVRKACADSLVVVAKGLESSKRHSAVFELFMVFCEDVSRWVRVSACQQLGQLLYTFDKGTVTVNMLKYFTDMAFQGESSNDSDFSEYCAHSFPGVLQGIGKERWGEMEASFQMLIKDVQWKVRKTMAHCLHEIAQIIGQEPSERVLVPAFELFLRDLDEIKVAALQKCHVFIGVLGNAQKERCVPLVCAVPGETENWRVRHVVAQRLGHLAKLVSPKFCKGCVTELSLKLLEDSVADVRYSGFYAVGQVLKKLSEEDGAFIQDTLHTVTAYATKPNYNVRLMFIYIAQQVAENDNKKLFEGEFIDRLLALADDKVANVRLALAKTLSASILHSEGVKSHPKVTLMKKKLSEDKDDDVATFASKVTKKCTDATRAAYLYRTL